jgi:hypothetical protein
METVVLVIALLACPLAMLLMALFMRKGMVSKSDPGSPWTLDDLRAEHRQLGGEIERRERAENGTGLKSVQR